MVDDKYWIKGWDSEAAITGAKAHCAKVGGNFLMLEMKGSTTRKSAKLIFKCEYLLDS